MEYFRVRNWEKHQHYKKRNPPWIKLYTALLDDYKYGCLQDASKLLALSILMLAAKTENKMPMSPEWIQHRASLKQPPDFDELLSIRFIELIDASNLLADCYQDASLSRDRDRDRGDRDIQTDCAEGAEGRFRIRSLKDEWKTTRQQQAESTTIDEKCPF